MECHVDSWLAIVTGRHAPEMGLLVFLKTDKFCLLVRSVVVDASSCLVCSLRYVVSVAAVESVVLQRVLTALCRLYIYIYIYIYIYTHTHSQRNTFLPAISIVNVLLN